MTTIRAGRGRCSNCDALRANRVVPKVGQALISSTSLGTDGRPSLQRIADRGIASPIPMMRASMPSIFFPPVETTHDRATGLDFRSPARSLGQVSPLIAAEEAFPAMERLVLGASETLHMAFRIFDPATRLRSKEARARGLETWADLLIDRAQDGVTVRVWINDFDAVIGNKLHRGAWTNAGHLADRLARAPDAADRLHMVVTVHEGQFGHAARWAFWWPVRRRIAKLIGGEDGKKTIEESPGLSEAIDRSSDTASIVAIPPIRMWPVTHHHKLMIADGHSAILGGLDINERRFDTAEHEQPAQQTWHDTALQVDGALASDCDRHFRTLWNREAKRFNAELDRYRTSGNSAFADRFARVDEAPLACPDVPQSDSTNLEASGCGQIVRTVTIRRSNPFAMAPGCVRHDIKDAYERLFETAESIVYLENQFLRHRKTLRVLGRRLREQKSLQAIVLLPHAPDDIAFEDHRDLDARHAEWLQARAIDELKEAGGDRIGFFSLVRNHPLEESDDVGPRGHAYGSGIIYIHSKLVIVDDRHAMIGSANLNGRSLLMDTEIALLWSHAESVRNLRERLWRSHFGDKLPETGTSPLESWREIAERNAEAAPADRQGFVVPHKVSEARRFGRWVWFVPDRFL